MNESLKEGEQADHPAESNQAAEARNAAKRSDGQRDHQESQRPDSCELRYVFNGVGAESAIQALVSKPDRSANPSQWRKAGEKNNRLEDPPAIRLRHSNSVVAAQVHS